MRLIVTWGAADRKVGGLRQADEHHASPTMTHHDVPFVVSLIWLAALNGGMILLLLW